ncbi:MAG: hypothetical protein IJ197_01505 [Bacteroidaceae bacterium]|nr:hypothetical protein [Bacteroidaceae bacterium]
MATTRAADSSCPSNPFAPPFGSCQRKNSPTTTAAATPMAGDTIHQRRWPRPSSPRGELDRGLIRAITLS